jgi:hypothetical protein
VDDADADDDDAADLVELFSVDTGIGGCAFDFDVSGCIFSNMDSIFLSRVSKLSI